MQLDQIIDARSPGVTPGVKRLPNIKALTSIRFFAALHVALYHYVRPFSLWGPFAPVMRIGYVGVSFFFVFSGFILTYSHAQEYEQGKGTALKFWAARFARIYPVYLLSMLFAGWAGRAQFHPRIHVLAYIADLFMMQAWSARMVNFFNVPAWTLSVEAFFYLLFPFLLMRLRPTSAKRSTLAVLFFWILAIAVPLLCLRLYPGASWQEDAYSPGSGIQVFRVSRLPLLALPQFLAGVSLGWLFLRYRPGIKTGTYLTTIGAAALAAALMLSDHLPYILLHNGLLIPIFALLILGLSQPNWLSRLLAFPPLVLLGEASYALYLVHFLFNDWSKGTFGLGNSIREALWKLAIVIPLSILIHLFVERPCRLIILRWWSRKHPDELRVNAT
jgi:peptidoglycan/LPS O-acetylase OafA/YrhL